MKVHKKEEKDCKKEINTAALKRDSKTQQGPALTHTGAALSQSGLQKRR
jgi:hypothetical protein